MKRALLLLVLSLLLPHHAQAHRASDSYLVLVPERAAPGFEGHWDIALSDLDYALGLDDGDGQLRWGEIRAREQESIRVALAGLSFRTRAGACKLSAGALGLVALSDGAYARLPLTVGCPSDDEATLEYRFMASLDRDHRAIVRVGEGESALSSVIGSDQPSLRLPSLGTRARHHAFDELLDYAGRGLTHIFEGVDHILFLLVLLLPAVLARSGAELQPVARIRPVLIDVAKIVTAFTLAHSLTLSLATLGVLSTSASVIEPAIAASVTLAALNNLYPVFGSDRWAMAFALGLLHGFGFSSALQDAGLSGTALLPALFGFNLGVELGQLSLVALFVPVAFLARHTHLYRAYALRGGSLAVLALSLFWFFERLQTG